MAQKEEEKLEEEDDNKPNETMLEKKEERDPDEAVFAEQAIHHYASDVLATFTDQVESAMGSLESFMLSQTDQDVLNDRGFLEGLGTTFLHHAMQAFGGHQTPIAQAVLPILEDMIDQSSREGNAHEFVTDLTSSLRDASWFIRDNLQSILSNQWDELRDLAYEGSTDFIPALHAYGLPEMDYDAKNVTQPMEHHTHEYLALAPKKKEEEIEQGQLSQFEEEEKRIEEDPTAQNLVLEEEEKEAMT